MRYLKRFNEEVLVGYDERKRFLEDIEIAFINNVVDHSELLHLPDEEEFENGFYYQINDFFMSLDLNEPFLEILIWCDEKFIGEMLALEKPIERFFRNVSNFGYDFAILLSDIDIWTNYGKKIRKSLVDYTDNIYYEGSDSDSAFKIKIYYN